MSNIEIHFTKPPTNQQALNKVLGAIKLSKAAVKEITLTYKNDTLRLTKDPEDKSWQIEGKLNDYTADQLIDDMNAQ